jgi:hypothetical protein
MGRVPNRNAAGCLRIVTALVGYASEETFFLGGGSSQ